MRRAIFATWSTVPAQMTTLLMICALKEKHLGAFYNKHIAQKKDVPPGIHLEKIHHPIREDIKNELMEIYKRYSTGELLSRCTRFTQKANENLISVIWSTASKNIFYHSDRLHYLVAMPYCSSTMGTQEVHPQNMGQLE